MAPYLWGHQYEILCVNLYPKTTRVVVCCGERSCIGPNRKVRQDFNQRTKVLMPVASAYVLAMCHCISEQRIRLKVDYLLERCLAIPKSRRTDNASSMLCLYCCKLRAHSCDDRKGDGQGINNLQDRHKPPRRWEPTPKVNGETFTGCLSLKERFR